MRTEYDQFEDYQPIRRVSVFNEEDFEKLKKNEKFMEMVTKTVPEMFCFLTNDLFSDTNCPNCNCPTISSVVSLETNDFVPECVACKLQFKTDPL